MGSHRGGNAPAGPGPLSRRSSPFLLIVVEYAAGLTLFFLLLGGNRTIQPGFWGDGLFRLSEILRDVGLRPTLAQGGGPSSVLRVRFGSQFEEDPEAGTAGSVSVEPVWGRVT